MNYQDSGKGYCNHCDCWQLGRETSAGFYCYFCQHNSVDYITLNVGSTNKLEVIKTHEKLFGL